MNRQLVVAMIALLCYGATLAEEHSPNRSLADMSTDERIEIMRLATLYDSCVYTEAMTASANYSDIRHAADFALGQCHTTLMELEAGISAMGFELAYARSFSNRTRNRAARKIMPELAVRRGGG